MDGKRRKPSDYRYTIMHRATSRYFRFPLGREAVVRRGEDFVEDVVGCLFSARDALEIFVQLTHE